MINLFYNLAVRQQTEFERLRAQKLVPRARARMLVDALASPLVKVISGPRRAGKSTLAIQALAGRRCAYLNFEDETLPPLPDGDALIEALDSVYGDVEFYLFDEIQNFPRWEQLVNRLHRLGKNLVVTGSNARLLSEELASALTGRHLAIELLPFSYDEALAGESGTPQIFLDYLVRGGFPEVVLGEADYRSYLSTLWEAVVLKDIVQRRRVRNVSALREVLSLFLASIGSRYSYESLARGLGGQVSAPTAKKFISYGSEAYLVAELSAFHRKPRVRLKSDHKAYLVDNGFYSARQAGIFDDRSKLLENMVFVELWRRGHRPNLDLFYYQTSDAFEVDFLVRRGHENLELIQVAYSLATAKTREREFRALIRAGDELSVHKLTVITLDESRLEQIEGQKVEVVSAPQWLLKNRPR